MTPEQLRARLERAIEEADYVPPSTDRDRVAAGVHASVCDPFPLAAEVTMEMPGFEVGVRIEGLCVAHEQGCWLVYRQENDEFYCFWGERPEQLQAYGIFGNPLYCWSA